MHWLLLAATLAMGGDLDDFVPGPRPFAAAVDDPWAIFVNPAGTGNTPYTQLMGAMGRQDTEGGAITHMTLGYIRPYEPIATAAVGAGYFLGRLRGGNKDQFALHYAQELKVPYVPLTKPLRLGGNVKFIKLENKFGLGFDGGVLLRTNYGLSGSFSVRDFFSVVPHPTWTLGTAYTWRKWVSLMGDLRVRTGLTEFYPGVETTLLNGLLKTRLQRGPRLHHAETVATGLTVNFSPVILDATVSMPVRGVHLRAGGWQAGLTYRFGAPSFAGNFIGAAASSADALRAEIARLEAQRDSLGTQAKTQATNRDVATGELRVLESRLREAQEELRMLRKRRDELQYELTGLRHEKEQDEPKPEPPPKPKPAPPPVIWPKRHVVKDGETLRGLASRYYGDAARWEPIYEANRDKVDRGLPRVGELLVIPEPTWRR